MKTPNSSLLKTAACTAPAISVVIPVYNVEEYLAECLDSVLNQSIRDIEVICVNDGSTDGSLKLVLEYADRDDRITVFDQENAGLSAARNAGTDLSRGEYLYFLDSDDYLVPGTFEKLLTVAREQNTDILYFGAESFFEDGELEQKHNNYVNFYQRRPTFSHPVSGDIFLLDQLQKWLFRSSVPLQFIRREFLMESGIRFRSGILHEDELFSCLLAAKSRRSLCVSDSFYMRRVRANSIMTAEYTARKFSGFFMVATTLMSSAVTDTGLSQTARDAVSFHANKILQDAKNTYRKLPQSEKDKIMDLLPPEFQPFYREMSSSFEGSYVDLAEIKQSSAYRIGMAVTFLPRLCRRAVTSVKKHGLKYTIQNGLRMVRDKLSGLFSR